MSGKTFQKAEQIFLANGVCHGNRSSSPGCKRPTTPGFSGWRFLPVGFLEKASLISDGPQAPPLRTTLSQADLSLDNQDRASVAVG